MYVRDTLHNLLRVLLRDKFPFKNEADIGKLVDQIQAVNPMMIHMGQSEGRASSKNNAILNQTNNSKDAGLVQPGIIDEWMWRRIIEKMYDEVDARQLEERFIEQICIRDRVCASN